MTSPASHVEKPVSPGPAQTKPLWWWPAYLIAALAAAAYTALSLARWHRQDNPSWDLGIFEQAVKGYAHFQAPVVDLKGPDFVQLGDHFSPILALLAPFYRLWPSATTLLVAQALLVALSVVPIGLAARRRLTGPGAVLLTSAYAISWGLQTAVDCQFHEYAFAVPILAFALVAYLDRRWLAAAIWAGLLLLVKEDLGLTVAALGLVMAGQGYARCRRPSLRRNLPLARGDSDATDGRRQLRIGLVTFLGGVVGALLVLRVVIPAFNVEGTWDYWGDVGNAEESVGLLASLTSGLGVKLGTVVMLVALVAGACLRSWLVVLVLPTMAWRMVSGVEFHWGTDYHYSMILMPIVFVAAIDALAKLRQSDHRLWRLYAKAVPALSLAFGLLVLPFFPLSDLVRPSTWAAPTRGTWTAEVMELMPKGSSVATDTGLLCQLVSDHTVYWLTPDQEPAPDFVLVDPEAGWSEDPGDPAELAMSYYPGHTYVTLLDASSSPFRLAQRLD
ncbi:MAG: DUF2079 domain-containing protein [Micrococcales bacterium]|nr:DUF2079 domain-containing protein [Micrococcales bacterium]